MLLDKKNIDGIQSYLQSHQLINLDETVLGAEKPGEGNMNYVLRVKTTGRSLIIKQARPYVEKYPTISAPEERALIEGKFYKTIATNDQLKAAMPSLIRVDKENHIIILQDLGEANDFTFLYKPGFQLSEEEARTLGSFLSVLHNSFKSPEVDELMANRKLRALNHEHIFIYPLIENGFDLNTIQQGLQELSVSFKNSDPLKKKAEELGAIYLRDGDTLLHGDYYPGSWLRTSDGVKIIDPEFCFYGKTEFDLGVLIAHLKIAHQNNEVMKAVLSSYKKVPGFDEHLLNEFIGIEIVRRIIGLAQLPLTLNLKEKEVLLEEAVKLLGI